MSIGRVCTCGHTAAPRRTCRLDGGHDPADAAWVGVGVEQRRQGGGDAVAQRQVGELLDAGDGQVGVVELVDDLQDASRSPSTADSASSSSGAAQRLGTGR